MRGAINLALSGAILAADQLLKAWIRSSFVRTEARPLIGGFVRLTRVHNTGGAFGILPGGSSVFIAVSLVVSIGLAVYLLLGRGDRWARLGAALTLGGAAGNLVDRLVHGYVLDFFELRGFSVLNLADACITIGIFLLLVRSIFGGDEHRARE